MRLAAALRAWHHPVVRFDQFTVALLIINPDGPVLTEEQENALQEAHMAHLADLHDAGHLIAAGPLMDMPDRSYRGLSILTGRCRDRTRIEGPGPGRTSREVHREGDALDGPGRGDRRR